MALRLLAFYASWLRYHFAPGRVLRLSAGLLSLLKEWAGRAGQLTSLQLITHSVYRMQQLLMHM